MNTPEWIGYLNKYKELDGEMIHRYKGITLSKKNIAVIIEPRNHDLLQRVFNNFYSKLVDQDFHFVIAHGTENAAQAQTITDSLPHVDLWNLQVDNLTIQKYNELLVSEKFWNHFKNVYDATYVLVFQTDTLLLKDNIREFMNVDYIGAPWSFEHYPGCFVGNGGLSLRSVKSMLHVIQKYAYHSLVPKYNEDIYFSLFLGKVGYKIANIDTAKRFSSETMNSDDPMGLHKPSPGPFEHVKHKLL